MKKYIKPILLSVAMVLVLNTIIFAVLTLHQAPYYDDAPQKADSIYGLYASDKYNDILYLFTTGYIRGGDEKIQEIEHMLKTTSATRLNWLQSYCKMITLNRNDFVVYTRTTVTADRKVAKKNLVASNTYVFVEKDIVYIICLEFTEYEFQKGYQKAVVYQAQKAELAELLEKYKTDTGHGFKIVLPDWRNDISKFPDSYNSRQYALFFLIEFIVAMFVSNKIFQKRKNDKKTELKEKRKTEKNYGKRKK